MKTKKKASKVTRKKARNKTTKEAKFEGWLSGIHPVNIDPADIPLTGVEITIRFVTDDAEELKDFTEEILELGRSIGAAKVTAQEYLT